MDLFEAFGLAPGAIVAAVGGGGKTTLVFALAAEAAGRGLSAIVTTSTKFTPPRGAPLPPAIETTAARAAEDLRAQLSPGSVIVATSGAAPKGRLTGFAREALDSLATIGAGLIAIEADGSAGRPFKAPAGHEPVIPSRVTAVVVCVGLGALGQPIDETHVHRSEIVARLARVAPGSPVTHQVILDVLLSDEGGKKGVPREAKLHALLNGTRNDDDLRLATHIGQRLVYAGYCRAVVANAHVPGDIRAVIQ